MEKMSNLLFNLFQNIPRRITRYPNRTLLFYSTTSSLIPEVSRDRKTIHLSYSDGQGDNNGINYHVKWLRHNCQCSQCISTSGQKLVTGRDLMYDMRIRNAKIDGHRLLVEWSTADTTNTLHEGHLDIKWLQSQFTSEKEKLKSTPSFPTTSIPFVEYKEVMKNDEGLYKWLYHLADNGVCILNNVPTNIEDTLKVASRIGYVQDTIYGRTFDVKVEKSDLTNIAYSEVGLEMHMDLQYYQSPPGLQILHCYKNDECIEGGESTLLDGLGVIEGLRKTHPQYFNTLSTVHVPFEKLHFDRDTPVSMLYRKPHIELDRNGMVVGLNWSPAHQGTLNVYEEDIEEYYEAYVHLFELLNNSPLTITHRLQPGQLLSFNNRRMLHGRKSYKSNGGERHLKGFYVNIDEFASKLAVIGRTLGKNKPLKHVINTSQYF